MTAAEAEYLLANETLTEIFAQIERDAVELAVSAPVGDDETRRNATGEVRAIRSVRRKLEALVRAKTNPVPGAVV